MISSIYFTYLIISEDFGEILFNFTLERDFGEKRHRPSVLKICWQRTETNKIFS